MWIVCARAIQSEPLDDNASEDTDQRDIFVSHPSTVNQPDRQVSYVVCRDCKTERK